MKKIIVFAFIFFIAIFIFSTTIYNQTLKISKVYYGFKLLSKEHIKDIDSDIFVFKHKKTNANLIYVKNNDENKMFSITFKTPVDDSSGVNHILEHSVLCGSKKYPVKDPFLQMKKSSLSTFLNALTYKDKTMYPVSSRNDKDLKNLMSVYLDAVFFPNVCKDENIFKQEGIRQEIDYINGSIKYSGIVFNEMKGSYSSVENILLKDIYKSLYPNSSYRFDSGGDPEHIKRLTYKKLINTYEKYYHPSNSYIYLYGDLKVLDYLKFINNDYLSKFKNNDVQIDIVNQTPFSIKREENYYYNSNDNTNYLALNYALDDIKSDKDVKLMEFFLQLLFLDDSFKNELLSKNLCQNIYPFFDDEIKQPFFSIILEGVDISKREDVEKLINDYFINLYNSDISKEKINACKNIYKTKNESEDMNVSKAFFYNTQIMKSWLYGYNPVLYLKNREFKYSKEDLKDFMKRYVLENNHFSSALLMPTGNIIENDSKDKFSKEEKSKILEETKKFKAWQNKKDSKQALKTIPKLTLRDINKYVEPIQTDKINKDKTTILKNYVDSKDFVYSNLYFDISSIKQDELPYLYLLCDLMLDLNSKNFSNEQLSLQAKTYLSSVNFKVDAVTDYYDYKKYYPKLVLSYSTFYDDKYGANVINELLHNLKFDKYTLYTSLKKIKSSLENNITSNSISVVSKRCKSYFSPRDRFLELSNIEYYKFIKLLYNDFENTDLDDKLKSIYEKSFNKNNLIVSISAEKNKSAIYEKNIFGVIDNLKSFNTDKQTYKFDDLKSEFFTPSSMNVQYIAKGLNYKNFGYEYKPCMFVMKKILNDDYIWKNIRVKGGAYGGYFDIQRDGNMIFYSHNDPNLTKSINTFDNAYKYIRDIDINKEELKSFIIGAIGELDKLKTPFEKAAINDYKYISNTPKDIENFDRKAILNTNLKDIKSCYKILNLMKSTNFYCIIGEEKKAKEENFNIDLLK